MTTFETVWRLNYPSECPIGYLLRDAGTRPWVRFHSLPLSKRYAETEEEKQILLERQNELAARVLRSDPCWLAQSFWQAPEATMRRDRGGNEWASPEWACREYGLTFGFRFTVDEGDGELHAWDAYAVRTRWQKGGFDQLLWAIANEQSARTIWLSENTGDVFAPYDGGVDLFLADPSAVADFRRDYGRWLSQRPDGL